jgi:hypothetical protein
MSHCGRCAEFSERERMSSGGEDDAAIAGRFPKVGPIWQKPASVLRSGAMRHILQRTQSDCVIAALACVTYISYSALKKAFGPLKGGIERHEIESLMDRFQLAWQRQDAQEPITPRQWANLYQRRAILVIEPIEAAGKIRRVLATDEGELFDPANGSSGPPTEVTTAYIFP